MIYRFLATFTDKQFCTEFCQFPRKKAGKKKDFPDLRCNFNFLAKDKIMTEVTNLGFSMSLGHTDTLLTLSRSTHKFIIKIIYY